MCDVKRTTTMIHSRQRGSSTTSQYSSRFAEQARSSRSSFKIMTHPKIRHVQLAFFVALFVTTLWTISWTLYHYPLFPLNPSSLDWNNRWLVATVIDYYGACLCFCGVVLSTEPTWLRGIAWVLGCSLLGSPVCCAWVLLTLYQGGSLRLEKRIRSHGDEGMAGLTTSSGAMSYS